MQELLSALLTSVEEQSEALGEVPTSTSLLGLFTVLTTTIIIMAKQLVEINQTLQSGTLNKDKEEK